MTKHTWSRFSNWNYYYEFTFCFSLFHQLGGQRPLETKTRWFLFKDILSVQPQELLYSVQESEGDLLLKYLFGNLVPRARLFSSSSIWQIRKPFNRLTIRLNNFQWDFILPAVVLTRKTHNFPCWKTLSTRRNPTILLQTVLPLVAKIQQAYVLDVLIYYYRLMIIDFRSINVCSFPRNPKWKTQKLLEKFPEITATEAKPTHESQSGSL